MANLPKTNARLSISAKFWVSLADVSDTQVIPTGVDKPRSLGSIESFVEANPRSTDPRYEINSDTPGEILERIPQLVNRSITIKRAVLYTEDLLGMFGTTDMDDIVDQNKPFTIFKVEASPAVTVAGTSTSGSTVAGSKTTIYTGCWFHANPKSYDISGGLKMVQEAEIGYAKRFVVTGTPA